MERCFDGPAMRWSDALIARMRRHIGGTVATVETALRLALGEDPALDGKAVDALPAGYAVAILRQQPERLSAALARHFRDRAGLALMVQQTGGSADMRKAAEAPDSEISGTVGEALAALALAQRGWMDTQPDDAPMRADLPAEHMADLVWTVAAILAQGLGAGWLRALDRAGLTVLARHDEGQGPVALAGLLAHRAHRQRWTEAHLIELARAGQVLALLALAADRLDGDLETLMSLAVEAPEESLFGVFRAADFPREVAVRLVLGRRCVARGADDSTLIAYADAYDRLTPEEARSALVELGLSPLFRRHLDAGRRAGDWMEPEADVRSAL